MFKSPDGSTFVIAAVEFCNPTKARALASVVVIAKVQTKKKPPKPVALPLQVVRSVPLSPAKEPAPAALAKRVRHIAVRLLVVANAG
jgi:hypothetical protein